MKRTVFTLLCLFTICSFGQESYNNRIYPLKGINLMKGYWFVSITNIENIFRNVEYTEVIIDQQLIRSNIDSLYIIKSEYFEDCKYKTPGYKLCLYHDNKKIYSFSFCYPDQISLGSFKGHFLDAELLKEWCIKKDIKSKNDSLMKTPNHIILKPVKGRNNMILFSFLRFHSK